MLRARSASTAGVSSRARRPRWPLPAASRLGFACPGRGGRAAEGTRLLSEYGVTTPSRVRIPPSPSSDVSGRTRSVRGRVGSGPVLDCGGALSMAHEFSGSADIDWPIDEVFAFLADGTNDPKFSPRVLEIRKATDGPVGVGTLFDSRVKDAGMTTSRARGSRRRKGDRRVRHEGGRQGRAGTRCSDQGGCRSRVRAADAPIGSARGAGVDARWPMTSSPSGCGAR